MAPCRSQFHQPVFAVPGVQREGLPYEDGRRCRAEADTYPLVDADHIEDDEQDEESQQTSAEDEEVLSFKPLNSTGRPIPLFIGYSAIHCLLKEE